MSDKFSLFSGNRSPHRKERLLSYSPDVDLPNQWLAIAIETGLRLLHRKINSREDLIDIANTSIQILPTLNHNQNDEIVLLSLDEFVHKAERYREQLEELDKFEIVFEQFPLALQQLDQVSRSIGSSVIALFYSPSILFLTCFDNNDNNHELSLFYPSTTQQLGSNTSSMDMEIQFWEGQQMDKLLEEMEFRSNQWEHPYEITILRLRTTNDGKAVPYKPLLTMAKGTLGNGNNSNSNSNSNKSRNGGKNSVRFSSLPPKYNNNKTSNNNNTTSQPTDKMEEGDSIANNNNKKRTEEDPASFLHQLSDTLQQFSIEIRENYSPEIEELILANQQLLVDNQVLATRIKEVERELLERDSVYEREIER